MKPDLRSANYKSRPTSIWALLSTISVNEEASHFVRGDLLSEEKEAKAPHKTLEWGFFCVLSHCNRLEGGVK
ncbi:MAG: hypothetical protein K9I47_09120 [Bacteroidales bacterium]|nr:hypothetical protein [Bacteroidales bacterium]